LKHYLYSGTSIRPLGNIVAAIRSSQNNTPSQVFYETTDISILILNIINKTAKTFLSVETGREWANLAPYGAVKKLVTEIINTAGK